MFAYNSCFTYSLIKKCSWHSDKYNLNSSLSVPCTNNVMLIIGERMIDGTVKLVKDARDASQTTAFSPKCFCWNAVCVCLSSFVACLFLRTRVFMNASTLMVFRSWKKAFGISAAFIYLSRDGKSWVRHLDQGAWPECAAAHVQGTDQCPQWPCYQHSVSVTRLHP